VNHGQRDILVGTDRGPGRPADPDHARAPSVDRPEPRFGPRADQARPLSTTDGHTLPNQHTPAKTPAQQSDRAPRTNAHRASPTSRSGAGRAAAGRSGAGRSGASRSRAGQPAAGRPRGRGLPGPTVGADRPLTVPTRAPRPPVESFADAGLPAALVTELRRRGITSPFAIQAAALPDALAGEHLLGRARTGSGKTLGFGLPMLARLSDRPGDRDTDRPATDRSATDRPGTNRRDDGRSDNERRDGSRRGNDRRRNDRARGGRRDGAGESRTTVPAAPGRPRGLVLVPTRELAQQAHDVLGPLGRAVRLRVAAVYGGVSISRQIDAARRGVDVVVATPGRLTDLLGRGALTLDGVEIVVLDEADHMCDLGFLPQVRTLLDAVGPGAQHLLFSATLDRDVEVLVREYLPNPVLVAVEPEAGGEVTLARHAFEAPDAAERSRLVAALAGGLGRTLVFANTQHGVEHLARQLTRAGVPALPLHGGMSQGARSRTLRAFSDDSARVVVATDVAARGLHVDGIDLVVHSGPALDAKTHQHRCGRTARAGASGATVIVSVPEERRAVAALLRAGTPGGADRAGREQTGAGRVERLDADDPRVAALVGPPAPRVPYVPGQPDLAAPPARPATRRLPRSTGGSGGSGSGIGASAARRRAGGRRLTSHK
jgi:superfamily II DNA/RNA helicase